MSGGHRRLAARRRVLEAAATFSSATGMHSLLDARNFKAGGCILAFHQIAAAQLERQVELHVGRYEIVSLDTLVDRRLAGRSTAGLMALTFDDGYRSTVHEAAALAQQRGWPMTFFLPTGAVDGDSPYWFVQLRVLLEELPPAAPFEVVIHGRSFLIGSSEAERRDAVAQIEAFLFYRPQAELDAGIEQLRAGLQDLPAVGHASWSKPSDATQSATDAQAVGWYDVEQLSRNELVTFGAHTVSHPFLSTLNRLQVERELLVSKRKIQNHWGRDVRHFCYPYGDERSIGVDAPAVAAQHFDSAVTMIRGRCRAAADPYMLPRIPLYEGDRPSVAGLKVSMAA